MGTPQNSLFSLLSLFQKNFTISRNLPKFWQKISLHSFLRHGVYAATGKTRTLLQEADDGDLKRAGFHQSSPTFKMPRRRCRKVSPRGTKPPASPRQPAAHGSSCGPVRCQIIAECIVRWDAGVALGIQQQSSCYWPLAVGSDLSSAFLQMRVSPRTVHQLARILSWLGATRDFWRGHQDGLMTGVGHGDIGGGTCPQNSGKHFSGNVKLGYFVNFSYIYFRAKCLDSQID